MRGLLQNAAFYLLPMTTYGRFYIGIVQFFPICQLRDILRGLLVLLASHLNLMLNDDLAELEM